MFMCVCTCMYVLLSSSSMCSYLIVSCWHAPSKLAVSLPHGDRPFKLARAAWVSLLLGSAAATTRGKWSVPPYGILRYYDIIVWHDSPKHVVSQPEGHLLQVSQGHLQPWWAAAGRVWQPAVLHQHVAHGFATDYTAVAVLWKQIKSFDLKWNVPVSQTLSSVPPA
jgi:hypothetical protein